MKLGRAVVGFGDGVIDRVLCIGGAVAFSQVPEFIQQYVQRLGGHLDEARRQLAQFRHVAGESGLSLDRLIDQTRTNTDPAVAKLSGVMSASVERVQELEQAQAAITHASIWTRPFVFANHADRSIAQATWDAFQPAVPTTPEGFVYAALGVMLLLGLYQLCIRYPISRRYHRRRLAMPATI